MLTQLLAFLGVSVLVIVTPGPDTALTIRNTLAGGRAGGVATALGVGTGQAVWTLATSVGLAALIAASEPVFVAVRFAGAAYLVYRGIDALVSAFWLRGRKDERPRERMAPRLTAVTAYRRGLFSNLGNPKMVAFFTSLLPQFAPGGGASFAALLGLGLLFCVLTITWLTAYAVAVARAGDLLRRPAVRRRLEAITGAVLVALGLRLAAERA